MPNEKIKKEKGCKICGGKLFANTNLCLKHFKEHEKEKKEKKSIKVSNKATKTIKKFKNYKYKKKGVPTKVTKKKSENTSSLRKKADKVFSVFIRTRDEGVCFTCGCVKPWKEQQNGHYITRGCLPLRYDEKNCHCQCVGCNIFKKGNYTEYAIKMIEKYGVEELLRLIQIKNYSIAHPKRYGKEFYLDIIERYK